MSLGPHASAAHIINFFYEDSSGKNCPSVAKVNFHTFIVASHAWDGL
jgi:hypothetical protein